MRRHFRAAPRGMTIIEVLFAIVIMSGVMLALTRFGQGFTKAQRNAANLAVASDLAAARIEAIRAHGTYTTLISTFNSKTETSGSLDANPSMSGYADFTRTTTVVAGDSLDYVVATVTVTSTLLSSAMKKSVLIGAF